ncbi:MAG: hypothetical protein MZU97_04485 [Bacillus subtilis]|nr:hypothetical protein [Bacillus subtilis]
MPNGCLVELMYRRLARLRQFEVHRFFAIELLGRIEHQVLDGFHHQRCDTASTFVFLNRGTHSHGLFFQICQVRVVLQHRRKHPVDGIEHVIANVGIWIYLGLANDFHGIAETNHLHPGFFKFELKQ